MPPVSLFVRLLAVLWVTLQCGTVQASQQPAPSGPSADQATDLSTTLDVLWTVVDRAVTSSLEPLIADLNTRLSAIQSQLNFQDAEVLTRLGSLQNELHTVKTELTEEIAGINTQLDRIQTQLEPHGARLDSKNDCLATEITRVQTQLQRSMDDMKTELTAQNTEQKHRLSSLQDDLTAQTTVLNTSLNAAQTQPDSPVTEPTSCLHDVKTQLTAQSKNLVTRLDGLQTRLETKMDNLTTELVSRNAQLTDHLDSVKYSLLTALRPTYDCSDLAVTTPSGIHSLRPGHNRSVDAYCDMETEGGGWTVIQRRADIQPRQNFALGLDAYREGFGDLEKEFWWGLENMWLTTSMTGRQYELRIEMEDFDGEKRYAVYQEFRVSSEVDGYRMTVGDYSGDAGDGLTFHSGWQFSTMDMDRDGRQYSCAERYKGGWWYSKCHEANLNGLYLMGQNDKFAQGITWYKWKGHKYSLMRVEMKIRPTYSHCH